MLFSYAISDKSYVCNSKDYCWRRGYRVLGNAKMRIKTFLKSTKIAYDKPKT